MSYASVALTARTYLNVTLTSSEPRSVSLVSVTQHLTWSYTTLKEKSPELHQEQQMSRTASSYYLLCKEHP